MAKLAATKSFVQKKLFSETELRNFSATQRKLIGDLAIERIETRTRSGVDANGAAFKYHPDSEHVGDNLNDTGDMLSELDVISTRNGITIGYEDLASPEALQAEGHQKAFQSKGRWKKEFIGLSRSEKDIILAQADQEIATETTERERLFLDRFVEGLFSGQGEPDGEV